jgi:hypothetical protein
MRIAAGSAEEKPVSTSADRMDCCSQTSITGRMDGAKSELLKL